MWATCNVLLVREAALIISYPKLNFPTCLDIPPHFSFSLFPSTFQQLPAYSRDDIWKGIQGCEHA